MILDGPAPRFGEHRTPVAIADPPRRFRIDLVAPGYPRDLLAGEQHEVERRGGEPDQPLDPALQRELTGGTVGHGARL